MAQCLIALGANLGDRQATLDWVVERLGQVPGVRVVARSRWQETLPVGGPLNQGAFLNGAVLVETSLAPEGLLTVLQQLESERGRRRQVHWGPRTLDLDLLLYDCVVLETPALTLPHPRMAWRRFVLEPAAEVGAEMVHPTIGWTVAQLLDPLDTARPYVAITGLPGVGKTALVYRLAQVTGARPILGEWGGDDSSSILWDLELEFLERRTRLLAVDRLPWEVEGLWVSDFWFGQALAYAAVRLPTDQQEAFYQKWEEARARVVAPKLTVLVDSQPDVAELVRLRDALEEVLSTPCRGPVLRLADATSEPALAELQAAVLAMK